MDKHDRPTVLDQTMKACRSAFITVGIFSFCINLLVLTVPLFMVQVFDRVMTSRSEDTLLALILAAVMALGIMAALNVIRSRILIRTGLWLDSRLSPEMFAAGLRSSTHSGQRSIQGIRDLTQVRNFLTGSSVFAILDAPWIPLFLGLIFILHPSLGLVALIGAVMLLGLAYLNEVITRTPLRQANAATRHAMGSAETMVRQAETAGSMGMNRVLANWWTLQNARALELQAEASDRAGLILALSKFVRLALQIVILGLAALLVVHHEISVGAMIATSIIFARAMAPVEQCIGMWRNLVNARVAFGRIRHTLRRTEAEDERMPLPKPKGMLSASGVAFAPEGVHNPIFSEVSFEAAPGEMLGMTGPSGAGKSSLVRMLIGVNKPDQGRVRLDGADVFDWNGDDLGRHVGYVPQVVELLPGTIRENIARFTSTSPKKVVEAAKAAGVHDLILALPRGYDTMVGGAHDILSVGARQRLALARALFGEPQLLVLDEPYSNLDAGGVTALVTALERLKAKGATIIIVAHRPSILAHTDRVLLLQDGGAKVIDKKRPATLKVLNSNSGAAEETTAGAEKAESDAVKKGAAK